MKLTEKQKAFCRYYVKLRNGTQAALKAGYSEKTARDIAAENLAKPHINLYIRELREESYSIHNITLEDLYREKAKIAFHNPGEMYNWKTVDELNKAGKKTGRKKIEVNLKDSENIDMTAVRQIIHDYENGTLNFRFWDKHKALDTLITDIKEIQANDEDDLYYDLDNLRIVDCFQAWFFKEYHKPKYVFHVLKGGRASGKSTTVARQLIKDILRFPINILVVRKIKSTLFESCYEDLKQAINDLGVEHEFTCVGGVNFYIRRKRTGQRFLFRGGKEPERIKSIKTSKFPIARLWIEEATEFKTYDEAKIIVDSVVRAELPKHIKTSYKVTITYNPPKRKGAWVNQKYNREETIPDNCFVHKSTSFDNPHLSEAFLIEALEVKRENPDRFAWNYLGEVGQDIVPFSNLKTEKITNDMITSFDNICNGLDFGFAVDPLHFSRMYLDRTRNKLYIFGEIHQIKMSNTKLAERIIKNEWHDVPTICDCAEPKSISDLRALGVKALPAKKGQGSVEHGLEWLDSLNAIIIDKDRCPHTHREFYNIDYKSDKNGDLIPVLEDKDDHSIDSIRYALERFMTKKGRFFK